MIEIVDFGHINIVVDTINNANLYYQEFLGAKPVQEFKNFKNLGFAKSAGFIDNAGELDVSLLFMKIPNTSVYLELIVYNNPVNDNELQTFDINQIGGPRHICLRVKDIKSVFEHVKNTKNTTLINSSEQYKPCCLSKVNPSEFEFYNAELEADLNAKNQAAQNSSKISFFYVVDRYGVIWEFEEAPLDIEDPVTITKESIK